MVKMMKMPLLSLWLHVGCITNYPGRSSQHIYVAISTKMECLVNLHQPKCSFSQYICKLITGSLSVGPLSSNALCIASDTAADMTAGLLRRV